MGEGARRWAVAKGIPAAAPEVTVGSRGVNLPLQEALQALKDGGLCL